MKYKNASKATWEEQQVLKFLEIFFSAKVRLVESSLEEIYEETGVDVVTNKERWTYKLNGNSRLVIVYKHDQQKTKKSKEVLYTFLITSELSSKIPNVYYDNLSIILSEFFNKTRNNTFINFYNFYSIDVLYKTLISYMMSTAIFNKDYLYSWIEKIEKLSNSTFEGNYFTTGFIVSRRMEEILKKKSSDYSCFKSFKSFPIVDFENDYKRYWYLVDGKTNYYLANKNEDFSYILTIKKQQTGYRRYFLEDFIAGQDIVFRSFGHGELSIVNSDQIEIVKRENEWKIRSFDSFVDFFINSCLMNKDTAESLCFYILQCSKMHCSSIFWVPKKGTNSKAIDELISQKNDMRNSNINIKNQDYEQLLLRVFTSDGANIIDEKGNLMFCGAIVNMNVDTKQGMVGTGETAASKLGKKGVCIKVSQDGKIKIFKGDLKIVF